MGEECKYVLVTGGAGFVGSNLCERLLREGHHVMCLDNLYTGSLDTINDLMENENFEFLQMDILNKVAIEELRLLKIDEIYHLACPASPVHYQRDAIYTTRVCVEGTINMLELARHQGCRHPLLFDERSVRRPPCSPATRELLGQREPCRHSLMLRRRQALRREPLYGLPPPAQREGEDYPHFQYVRTEDGCGRWQGSF